MEIGIDIDGVLNSQYNFCIDYRNFEFDNITRAYSWYDIYYKIRNIKEYKNDISNN